MLRHLAILLSGALLLCSCGEKAPSVPPATKVSYQFENSPDFRGENAYIHCAALCALGPRLSGSAAYEQQLQYLEKHLADYGWKTTRQSFIGPNRTNMTNLHAVYGNSNENRPVLLSCHIDTKAGIAKDFEGADDGASGAAVLLETARILSSQPEEAQVVELVFFDGEESVAPRMTETDGLYGSRHDVLRRGDQLPEYMINLDMVGARNKTIAVPFFDSAPVLVNLYEETIDELSLNAKRWITTDQCYWDDDRPFREAGVHTINLICDFIDSIWWHTPRDNMSRICPRSLHESGLVTLRLLNKVRQLLP